MLICGVGNVDLSNRFRCYTMEAAKVKMCREEIRGESMIRPFISTFTALVALAFWTQPAVAQFTNQGGGTAFGSPSSGGTNTGGFGSTGTGNTGNSGFGGTTGGSGTTTNSSGGLSQSNGTGTSNNSTGGISLGGSSSAGTNSTGGFAFDSQQTQTGQTGQAAGATGFVGANQATGGFVGAATPTTGNFGSAGGSGGLGGAGGLSGLFSSQGFSSQLGRSGLGGTGSSTRAQVRTPIKLGFAYSGTSGEQASAMLEQRLAKIPVVHMSGAQIAVSMEGRTAVLVGTVATDREKALAGRLALLEPGISDVRNELVVESQATAPDSLPVPSPAP